MNSKRVFRSPWLLVLLVVLLIAIIAGPLSGSGGDKKVNLSTALMLLNTGQVDRALVNDTKQTVELTLDDGKKYDDADKVVATYPAEYSNQLTAAIQKPGNDVAQYATKVDTGNIWISLLTSFLPILLILGNWWTRRHPNRATSAEEASTPA